VREYAARVPATVQALLALLLGVLPGAIYLWAFEREAGKWGIGLSDQVLRFVAASAVFLTLYAGPLYFLYSRYIHHELVGRAGEPPKYENLLSAGHAPVGVLMVAVAVYLGFPAVLGTCAGIGVRKPDKTKWRKFARVVVGRDPAPRAWDEFFSSNRVGAVRGRLKSDRSWIGGLIDDDSYASGYGEVPQDLLLRQTYRMESDGAFVLEDDAPMELGSQLMIRWEELELLEYFPAKPVPQPTEAAPAPAGAVE